MKKERKFNRELFAVTLLYIIAGIGLTALLVYMARKYFDTAYLLAFGLGGLLVWLLILSLSLKHQWAGTILAFILCLGLIGGDIFVHKISDVTDNIVVVYDTYSVQIISAKNSKVTKDDSFLGLRLGYVGSEEYYTNWALGILQNNEKITGLEEVPYESYIDCFKDLVAGNIDLMVLSSIAEGELEEAADNGDISEYAYRSLFYDEQKMALEPLETVDINNNGFTILINGVDLSGTDIHKKARADVNILVTVNPTTAKVNIQVLPRDLWVEIPERGYKKTKLNRASSLEGTQGTINAIENYFDHTFKINYYAKMNFDGFISLVDKVGGIEVYSQYTYSAGGYTFKKGMNKMDGAKALMFCRARKMLPENDVSRGKNQMRVIQAIMEKFLKKPSVDKMFAILDVVEGNFVTSFTEKDFISMYNLLMNIKDRMVIESNSMKGNTKHYEMDPLIHQWLYYFIPDEGQKEAALQRILDTIDGK
ncbi:MAG: LCP family protein [Erysipelotrichaceae bacterium]|nr:LCP family protein [Erysipelotrichaceae bacterium]